MFCISRNTVRGHELSDYLSLPKVGASPLWLQKALSLFGGLADQPWCQGGQPSYAVTFTCVTALIQKLEVCLEIGGRLCLAADGTSGLGTVSEPEGGLHRGPAMSLVFILPTPCSCLCETSAGVQDVPHPWGMHRPSAV